MNKRFKESPRFNAASLATGSILALIVAMTVPIVFDTMSVSGDKVCL
jgi:hypothetical protein